MSDIVLFHHVLGLTAGVDAFARRLEASGRLVHTPDLFDGRVFTSIDDGAAFVDQVGFGAIVERGVAAASDYPRASVYAGISLGVLPAQQLAQTAANCEVALLLEACAPVTEFSERWPDSVVAQIHGRVDDPFFSGEGDIDNARALVEQSPQSTLFTYPGDEHLFLDDTLPSFDAAAATLVVERILDVLGPPTR